jgi:putative transposase
MQPKSSETVDEFTSNDVLNYNLGWSRHRLPHFNGNDTYQFISYRLIDSLPGSILNKLTDNNKDENDSEYRKSLEQLMDNGYGSCILNIDECANTIIENWHYFDTKRYRLIAYVIMPNHVHLLIQLLAGEILSRVIHSWKSYTSHEIKKILRLLENDDLFNQGGIWQREYWDRFIRSEEHLYNIITYIHHNPVKAGLVKNAKDWPWSTKSRNV